MTRSENGVSISSYVRVGTDRQAAVRPVNYVAYRIAGLPRVAFCQQMRAFMLIPQIVAARRVPLRENEMPDNTETRIPIHVHEAVGRPAFPSARRLISWAIRRTSGFHKTVRALLGDKRSCPPSLKFYLSQAIFY